MNISVNVLAFW